MAQQNSREKRPECAVRREESNLSRNPQRFHAILRAVNEVQLLERVQQCHRLAMGLNDAFTIKALHDLAGSYQRQAEAMGTQPSLLAVRISA